MLDALDATAVRHWCRVGLQGLAGAREEIDSLNVYPVPDGDTGTNLYLTVEAASAAIEALPGRADLGTTLHALTRGALLGARGSSGLILSQLLRGLISVPPPLTPTVDAALLQAALQRGVELGYEAVAEPAEGTMLTVARVAAEAASRGGGDLPATARAVADAARDSLRRTPEQLEVLARAGVVDAGGRGLCVLYDALLAVVTGTALEPARSRYDAGESAGQSAEESAGRRAAPLLGAAGPSAWCSGEPAYEVMYLLDTSGGRADGGDGEVEALRRRLGGMGSAAAVVGGDGVWNVHVHVHDPGPAIEAGMSAGRPYAIRVSALPAAQTPAFGGGGGGVSPGEGAGSATGRAVVAVVAGEGLRGLFTAAGARTVDGGPRRRPSAAELIEQILGAGAGEVVVLPNDGKSLAAAEAAAAQARRAGRRVAVVPARASTPALAALAVHDPGRGFDDDVVTMTAAAAQTRHGAVTLAAGEAVTTAGRCSPGEVLGLVDGDVLVLGEDLGAVACAVLDRMLAPGGELVTLVTGVGAPEGLAEAVRAHLGVAHPEVDVVVHPGGQPRYPLLIGVE